MAEKIKAEGGRQAARESAIARLAWRRAQGRKTIRELQGDRHRAPLLWLVLPFVAGASLRRAGGEWPLPHPGWCGAGLAAAAVLASFGRSRAAHALWAAAQCASAALIGLVAHSARAPFPAAPGRPEQVVLTLRISRLGQAHPARVFRARRGPAFPASPGPTVANGFGAIVPSGEPIYFSLLADPGMALPVRGAEIRLRGWIKAAPARGGPDTFAGYLRGAGIRRELAAARLVAVTEPPSWYAAQREALAQRLADLLQAGFSRRPDLAAIYRAMMLGRKDGLTAAQKSLFVRSGTMHLFAINGLHIGIVALSAHALLSLLRVRGCGCGLLVLAILWLDVDSTGAAPSTVRAFLMVALFEIGRAAWLPTNPLAALTGAAAVMLALDPSDAFGASFQMSFGVVAVLILLGVPLADHLRERWNPYPHLPAHSRTPWQTLRAAAQAHAASAAGFSAAAALVSAVTGVTYFGVWSPAGLPANVLVMPLASLVIIAGFASLVAGLAHLAWLTTLFNAAACLLLRAITAALEWIAQAPGASFPAHLRAAWIGPTALAALLAVCLRGYAAGWPRESGRYWPPFLVTALTLILGVKYG